MTCLNITGCVSSKNNKESSFNGLICDCMYTMSVFDCRSNLIMPMVIRKRNCRKPL